MKAKHRVLFITIFILFAFTACQTAKISFLCPLPSDFTVPRNVIKFKFDNRIENSDFYLGFKTLLDSISTYSCSIAESNSDYSETSTAIVYVAVDSSQYYAFTKDRFGNPYGKITYITFSVRLFDQKTKLYIDEYKFTLEKRVQVLIGNDTRDGTRIVAGQNYAYHIVPRRQLVYRKYYRRGNSSMKEAAKMVRYAHWDKAEDIWKKIQTDTTSKISGKVCFNIALAEEMQGNVDNAIGWVQKANKLGDKNSGAYLNELFRHQKALLQFKLQPVKK